VLIPLFSAPSTRSWGLGEFGDVEPLSAWLAHAGFDRLMLLPIGPLDGLVTSPYSAMSSMAIDPIYISLDASEDFRLAGGRSVLSEDARHRLEGAVASARVDYVAIRRAKGEALDLAFDRFLADEWSALTTRAAALAGYIARERWWLDDYALYRALSESAPRTSWLDWPRPVRDRDPQALDDMRRRFARDVLRHQYWQWIAEEQWQQARAAARSRGVSIIGDLPFVVSGESADVWTRAQEYLPDASVGAPPDAFSADGQDWHLPAYNWPLIAAGRFEWLRQRARRMAALFDGIRIDHLVGFFRTYVRPREGHPYFVPADEPSQIWQGEAILGIFLATGATILAEDLGTVPDFVRAALGRLGVAGSKVLRWERDWHAPGRPFLDPAAFPPASVALTGTHDTETLAVWWEHAGEHDRRALLAVPALWEWRFDSTQPWSDDVRDALLALAYRSGSSELLVPFQDIFGWRDRINVPATVDDRNWTWRLPWPVDRLNDVPAASERAQFCHALATATGRRA
jgi:4-alpha-glucanotransferase